jgi:hypothetical protein
MIFLEVLAQHFYEQLVNCEDTKYSEKLESLLICYFEVLLLDRLNQ